MALSKDTPRKYDPAYEPGFIDIEIASATTIYEGGALSDASGNGVANPLAASEAFLGFAERGVVNPASGTYKVRVRTKGVIKSLAVTGLDANTDFGVAVYAVDDGTFTLTSSTAHVQIGKVDSFNGNSGYGDVYFEGKHRRSI